MRVEAGLLFFSKNVRISKSGNAVHSSRAPIVTSLPLDKNAASSIESYTETLAHL